MASKKSAANRALGKAMRSVRRERGYNQEGLARRSGLDRGYYGAIERGEYNVSVDTAAKVAAGLGVRLSALFTRAGL